MTIHKITITRTPPDGHTITDPVDVLAATPDLALARVFSWYDYSSWMAQELHTPYRQEKPL